MKRCAPKNNNNTDFDYHEKKTTNLKRMLRLQSVWNNYSTKSRKVETPPCPKTTELNPLGRWLVLCASTRLQRENVILGDNCLVLTGIKLSATLRRLRAGAPSRQPRLTRKSRRLDSRLQSFLAACTPQSLRLSFLL